MIRPPSVDPGPDGLLAHYTFEDNLDDRFGNALDGTAVGDPSYVAKFFNGLMDEVRIYNRALSETEVRYLAGD